METGQAASNRIQTLRFLREQLAASGVAEAREEAERILMNLLNCPRTELYLGTDQPVDETVRERFLKILEARRQRIPLAYLLKEADFFQETLFVDERCLIPRPETEILIEQVSKALGTDNGEKFYFLDIGTGSGAIAVAILRLFKNAQGTLLDVSGGALEVARENLRRYALEDRANWAKGNLFEPFSGDAKWNLIVSNPPYLSARDWENVQEELTHEPREALDGGEDGLDFYRKIIPGARDRLNPGGLLAFEVGIGQAGTVSAWLREAGYDNIQRFRDHLGIERAVIARKPEKNPKS